MKTLLYTQPNEMQLLERTMPDLAPNDVVLKIEGVDICGSVMHA